MSNWKQSDGWGPTPTEPAHQKEWHEKLRRPDFHDSCSQNEGTWPAGPAPAGGSHAENFGHWDEATGTHIIENESSSPAGEKTK